MTERTEITGKPYLCPDHPRARIRHEWLRTRSTARLTGASWKHDHDHQYFCSECGRELAAESDPVKEGVVQWARLVNKGEKKP